MEHATLLDFSSVILPPENRADKFFLPHVRYFLRRRVLYPAELRRRVIFSGFLGLPTICHFSSGGCYYVTLGGGRSILLSYRNIF